MANSVKELLLVYGSALLRLPLLDLLVNQPNKFINNKVEYYVYWYPSRIDFEIQIPGRPGDPWGSYTPSAQGMLREKKAASVKLPLAIVNHAFQKFKLEKCRLYARCTFRQ